MMAGPVSDPAAIEFARGFYDAIGAEKDIESAYQEGCRAVKLLGLAEGFTPILIKSPEQELRSLFLTFFPNLCCDQNAAFRPWLQKDCFAVFERGIRKAVFSSRGQLTTRHILLALLEIEHGISAAAIAHFTPDLAQVRTRIEENIDKMSTRATKVEPTAALRDLILGIHDLWSTLHPLCFDGGTILQTVLNLEARSTTVAELLADLRCDRREMNRVIDEIRSKRRSTPPRK